MKPIDGMTTEPFGLPLMFDAWLGCVIWAAGSEENRADFTLETGHKLDSLYSRGINRMIDEATGHDKAVLVAWCDWVTRELWGENDPEIKP